MEVRAFEASPLTDRLVLVVGCPRSGTTWLEHLLLSHPAAGGIEEKETWLFLGLHPLMTNERIAQWTPRDDRVAALRRFCDRMFIAGLARHRPGATHFVEKTPNHALHLDEINTVYPDAWVIHLVRDGRDVVRSLLEFEHGVTDATTAAQLWVRTLTAVAASAPHLDRLREVRYEQLVADPVDGTAALLAWIGLPADDGVRAAIASRAGQRVSHFNTTGAVGSGKWRDLGAAARAEIDAVAGALLVERGYGLAGEPENGPGHTPGGGVSGTGRDARRACM